MFATGLARVESGFSQFADRSEASEFNSDAEMPERSFSIVMSAIHPSNLQDTADNAASPEIEFLRGPFRVSQSRSVATSRYSSNATSLLLHSQCLPNLLELSSTLVPCYLPWDSGECDCHLPTRSGLRPYYASCFMGPTAVRESDEVTAMVKTALRLGYRHIDTVHMHFAHVTETSN